jgi:hypothetical protein
MQQGEAELDAALSASLAQAQQQADALQRKQHVDELRAKGRQAIADLQFFADLGLADNDAFLVALGRCARRARRFRVCVWSADARIRACALTAWSTRARRRRS